MAKSKKKNGSADASKIEQERTALRRVFTTKFQQFKEIIETEADDKQVKILYGMLIEKAEHLFAMDDSLSELTSLTDDDYDTMEFYRDKFAEAKALLSYYAQPRKMDPSAKSDISATSNIKLPKLMLKEFDLIPRTWVSFWGQFSQIHEDKQMRGEEKFQYLLSSLKPKTKARDIVESYPTSKDNYDKVIEHLKSRFGREDLLIEVYIRDLLTLVNNGAGMKLSALYDKLGTHLRALETLGVTIQNYAAMLYPLVESCLPSDVLKVWHRYRLNKESTAEGTRFSCKEKMLKELMEFLGHEVEGEEHRALAEAGFGNNQKRESAKREGLPSSRFQEPSASSLVSASHMPEGKKCIFCERSHNSQECGKAGLMSQDERKSKAYVSLCLQHSKIHKIWDSETLGIMDPIERKTAKILKEEKAKFFQETIERKDERYEVALPWLSGHPPLYDSYDHAEARLCTVTKSLVKDNYESYGKVLKQRKEDNIIEVIREEETTEFKTYHLLHHPVRKMSSATTKIGPVFDASFRRPGYASLNDCLSVGLSLLHQIPAIINKFRCGSVLKSFFNPEDRDYLRFLRWKDEPFFKLKVYKPSRVVFGASPIPL